MASNNGAPASVSRPEPQTVTVPISELRELCRKSLKTIGYSDDEAKLMLDIMFYAQLRGNNQGIIKIATGALNRSPTAGEITVEKETRLSALINGAGNGGMLVLHRAMQLAIDKAKQHGFGIVGTNHTFTSTGALGYYAEHMGRQGMIGLVLAQSPEYVAPHGAKQAVFGTNPIALGVPAEDGPVTMDMATAAYAWFGLLEAKTAGRPIPADVAYNAAGEATTDPNDVLNGGAIRVFDRSHKGSALALMVELLAGPLVGAAVADKLEERNWGNLVVAIDPGLLGDPAAFRGRAQAVLDRVKGAARLPGVDEILLPGERGNRLAAARLASGVIPVEANLYNNLRVMASKWDDPAGSSTGGVGNSRSEPAYHLSTRLVHPPKPPGDPYRATSPPLYQTATFEQPSATTGGEYDYTRSGNPTRSALEEQFAALEGGDRGFAFTSGMAALAAAAKLVRTGEHILAGDDIYGGTSRLLDQVLPGFGVAVSNVDMSDLSAVRAAIIPGKTKLVWVESPTNPRMQVCDIAALAAIAHEAGALCLVDNSFMTAVYQRPLALGADISMVSGTKFIGGHSDVTCGLLAVRGTEVAKKIYFLQNAEGAGLAPFDCWLALRGIKTMALRMERQVANAGRLAAYLAAHPLVRSINYAGLPQHPGYDVHSRQATSAGSVLSFETGDAEASRIICDETKLFKVTVSFGNVTSQISMPCYMSHASIPADVRAARGLPDDLIRISTGIEHIDDLLADLDQAMRKAMDKVGPAKAREVVGAQRPGAAGAAGAGGAGGAGDGSRAEREAQLLQRIAELEQQLRGSAQQL